MAFTTIATSALDVGDPVTKELLDLVKSNEDDLDTRMTAVEGSTGKVVIFNEVVINAATLTAGGTVTGLDLYRAESAFNLTEAKVYIFEKGSLTGNLEIDIQLSASADFTSSNSVFTTKPKIVYASASSYDESANTVFNGTYQSITAGQYLRLDISELPAGGNIARIGIYFIGEIA
jgi:hypothetical protein